jgi:hypothetical protein
MGIDHQEAQINKRAVCASFILVHLLYENQRLTLDLENS